MRNLSLAEKLKSEDYKDHLSTRRLRELLICEKILSEEELEEESSIQLGYKKARKRFIDNTLAQINPQLAERAKEEKVPIFGVMDMIEDAYRSKGNRF